MLAQIGEPTRGLSGPSPYGWVYGLFELAMIVVPIALVTSPWWARRAYDWMFRPFGSKQTNTGDADDDANDRGRQP